MDTQSQMSAVNGAAPSNTNSNTNAETDQASSLTPSTLAYMTSVKKGDAPVSTLLQQDKDTLSSVADRDAKVRREVEEAMAKFQQASSNMMKT
ncbi:hypothetical protein F4819DRAFT_486049 [Hypoxylon fuscum]|nr:hypothetical protein F4819DRAFT_486049 [Hypoxylon fuscum]